ncbi:MAG: aminotransferase class V-fold PLP-dependent enzyme, partial [Planctomycetota bacterium]
ICHGRGVALLVDAAQTAGHEPIDVTRAGIDLLAAPGHKQLLGPMGTGFLYVGERVEADLAPLQQGGTGSLSESDQQPTAMPDRYESGNLNTPALAGLDAGLKLLASDEWQELAPQRAAVAERLQHELAAIEAITLHGPRGASPRTPVFSFSMAGYSPQDVAAVLAGRGIACRAGLHCAGRMHAALGTASNGGAVRLSPGFATTLAEVEHVAAALRELASAGALAR